MENNREILPYFMLQETEENSFRGNQEKRDRDYFRQLYPEEIKRYLKITEEIVDGISKEESFIFHEYPDRIRLEQLVENILEKVPVQNKFPREGQRHMIRILLFEEIIQRRAGRQYT